MFDCKKKKKLICFETDWTITTAPTTNQIERNYNIAVWKTVGLLVLDDYDDKQLGAEKCKMRNQHGAAVAQPLCSFFIFSIRDLCKI